MSTESIRHSVLVTIPQSEAFTRFAIDVGTWWPSANSLLEAPQARIVIEPWAGGAWFEEADDGQRCVWGRVLEWEPPSRFTLAWQLDVVSAGPDRCEERLVFVPELITEVELRFIALDGQRTLVELEHRHLDRFTTPAAARMLDDDGGWPTILRHYKATDGRLERSTT